MNVTMSYLVGVELLSMALFFLAYILYGRITHRPLIGAYKPGMLGYAAFRKIVDGRKYLIITIIAILFFAISAVSDARRILQSDSPHSILIVAPIMVILAFALIIPVLSKIFVPKK